MPAITSNRETKKTTPCNQFVPANTAKGIGKVVDKSEFKPRPTVKRDEYAKWHTCYAAYTVKIPNRNCHKIDTRCRRNFRCRVYLFKIGRGNLWLWKQWHMSRFFGSSSLSYFYVTAGHNYTNNWTYFHKLYKCHLFEHIFYEIWFTYHW